MFTFIFKFIFEYLFHFSKRNHPFFLFTLGYLWVLGMCVLFFCIYIYGCFDYLYPSTREIHPLSNTRTVLTLDLNNISVTSASATDTIVYREIRLRPIGIFF